MCLCLVLRAAASCRVPGRVPLDKTIQEPLWTSPRSRGPYKMHDCGAANPGHHWLTSVHTVNCWHATPTLEEETHTGAHTLTDPNTMPGLICLFFYISGKWQPVGDAGSCCPNCLTAGVTLASDPCFMEALHAIHLLYASIICIKPSLSRPRICASEYYVVLFWGVCTWTEGSSEGEKN